MTATQISRRSNLSNDACRRVLGELSRHGIVTCLNQSARRSRVYWFTELGVSAMKRFPGCNISFIDDYLSIDWNLYGWLCYRHRAAVLKSITEPLQPATMKRKARSRDPTLRMSANNVRDIIRLFLERGIVQAVKVRKKAHLRYDLTAAGSKLQQLLTQSEVPRTNF